jgi:hypothetical protein
VFDCRGHSAAARLRRLWRFGLIRIVRRLGIILLNIFHRIGHLLGRLLHDLVLREGTAEDHHELLFGVLRFEWHLERIAALASLLGAVANNGVPETHICFHRFHLDFDVLVADMVVDFVHTLPAEKAELFPFRVADVIVPALRLGKRPPAQVLVVEVQFPSDGLPGEPIDAQFRRQKKRIIEQFRPQSDHGGPPVNKCTYVY